MTIRFVDKEEDILKCYPALKKLRPDLMEDSYMLATRTMIGEGVKVLMLEAENAIPAVACFRVANYLFRGKNPI